MTASSRSPDLPVRLVVLNHNGGDLTIRCLRAILDLDWPADGLEVVCLDNDSTDGSADRIERELPQVDLRRLGSNIGFPANNRAFGDLDQVRYVGLVNNDAFVEPGWLASLVEVLDDDPGLGAACPKILLEPRFSTVSIQAPSFSAGSSDARSLGLCLRTVEVGGIDVSRAAHLDQTGWGREVDARGAFEWSRPTAALRVPAPTESGSFPIVVVFDLPSAGRVTIDGGEGPMEHDLPAGTHRIAVTVSGERVDVINGVGSLVYADGYGADRGWLAIDDGRFDEPVDVFAWSGGGVLLRPRYLEDVGLFDERFFLYYEDTDLSWRGRSRGWRYRTVPTARMRHVHAASSSDDSGLAQRLTERNRLLMLVRNASTRLAITQILRFPLTTASYARRDVVRPLLAGERPSGIRVGWRLRSFAGFLRLLPGALRDRRSLRALRILPVAEVESGLRVHE